MKKKYTFSFSMNQPRRIYTYVFQFPLGFRSPLCVYEDSDAAQRSLWIFPVYWKGFYKRKVDEESIRVRFSTTLELDQEELEHIKKDFPEQNGCTHSKILYQLFKTFNANNVQLVSSDPFSEYTVTTLGTINKEAMRNLCKE